MEDTGNDRFIVSGGRSTLNQALRTFLFVFCVMKQLKGAQVCNQGACVSGTLSQSLSLTEL